MKDSEQLYADDSKYQESTEILIHHSLCLLLNSMGLTYQPVRKAIRIALQNSTMQLAQVIAQLLNSCDDRYKILDSTLSLGGTTHLDDEILMVASNKTLTHHDDLRLSAVH